jgi:putative DNA primase/helicase
MNLQAVDNQAPELIQESSDINKPEFEGGRPHFWTTSEKGLNWETYDHKSGKSKRKLVKVGNHLKAIAYITDLETKSTSLFLELTTQNYGTKNLTIPRSDLCHLQRVLEKLLACGYEYESSCQKLLLKYLASSGKDLHLYSITNKTGWIEDLFVMPHKTYGDESLRFKTIEENPDSPYIPKGNLEDWKNNVAIPASNSSRLIFAIGCAFAALLLSSLEVEGGGFHFVGETSTGKTLLLKVAASVLGKPSQIIKRWRVTANGLESIAQEHNHLLLPLDEIGQLEPRETGNIAYMLANGQGKTRSNRSGDATPTKTWTILSLSTGEVSLADTITQGGKSIKAGQEVRMPDIPACPVDGYGIFEIHKEYKSSSDLVKALESATECCYGIPIDAFLVRLVQHKTPEWIQSKQAALEILSANLKSIAPNDNALGRIATRFALIELALLIAQKWGIVPFSQEQIKQSVKTIFEDWLSHRGGTGNIEIKKAVERIRLLFQQYINSNRIVEFSDQNSEGTSSSKLLAYKYNDELLVPVPIFDDEFCKGVNKRDLIKVLRDEGLLKSSKEKDRNTEKRRVNGKQINCYIFNNHFF